MGRELGEGSDIPLSAVGRVSCGSWLIYCAEPVDEVEVELVGGWDYKHENFLP